MHTYIHTCVQTYTYTCILQSLFHLNYFDLFYLSDVDEDHIAQTRNRVQQIQLEEMDETEKRFWETLCQTVEIASSPVEAENETKQAKLKEDLKVLRNSVLIGLLLTNAIWLILMATLLIPQLRVYFISIHLTELAFLSVYLLILIFQFIAMLVHRLITLSHYIAKSWLSKELAAFQQVEQEQNQPLAENRL